MEKVDKEYLINSTHKAIGRYIENGLLDARPRYLEAQLRYGLLFDPEVETYPKIRVDQISEFCGEARKEFEVFRLAKHFAAKGLRAHVFIPPKINALVADYLEGKFEHRGVGSGRPDQWGRDLTIMLSIRKLVQHHELHATHRRDLSTDPYKMRISEKSASELVHAVLANTQISNLALERIHKIWESRKKRRDLNKFLQLTIDAEFDNEPEALLI